MSIAKRPQKSPRTLTIDESAQELHVADVVRGRSAHPDGVHDFLAQPLSELWVFSKHVYGGRERGCSLRLDI